MKNKYCLPIIKTKKEEVLKIIHSSIANYTYFEVWLDYIDNLDSLFIEELVKLLDKRLILLFRRQNLEKVKIDLDKRLEIISLLNNSQSLIDLDIFDQKEELNYIAKDQLKIKLIVSYHDYQQTPRNEKLKEIVGIMNKYKPTIYKIATICNSQKDALRLLQLLLEFKEKNLKYIVLGMEKFGEITRIYGTIWGNEMIFAPQKNIDQSALGQLTRDQLQTIFKELKE